jgi:hypothetical protein
MKTKIKLQITLPKPRNPVALQARQRKAGMHQSDNPARHARRVEKQKLRLMLLGRDTEGNMDV